MNDRPDIPEPVKRAVRQQCFFGCVICGMPVFQYDHIQHWAEVREHAVDNLVLLCAGHHSDKTTGKLSAERVRERRVAPHNARRARTTGFRLEPNRSVELTLGSNSARCVFQNGNGLHRVLWINGWDFFVLHAEDGWLTVSLIVTDHRGQTLLSVEHGELTASTGVWDYRYEGTRLQIRAGSREILLDLNLSNAKAHILRGAFLEDTTGDGVVVGASGTMHVMHRWENVINITGCRATDNGNGAWGFVDPNVCPIWPAGGFGYFYVFEKPS